MKGHSKYLNPPFGSNLLSIITNYPELKRDVLDLFEGYGNQAIFDMVRQTLKFQREVNKGEVFQIPYTSIADTLQRIIFFKAAIASNDNSVLLFEEPEAHAFPPHMAHLTWGMISKKDNQFFVATYSPFILQIYGKTIRTNSPYSWYITKTVKPK